MQEAACLGSWPGHCHSRQVTAACFPGRRPLTQAPLPAPCPRGRPQAEAQGLGWQERERSREPGCAPETASQGPELGCARVVGTADPDPGFSVTQGAPSFVGREARPGGVPGPWPASRGGGRPASPPARPPAPYPPNSTPGKAVQIKARGRPFDPRSTLAPRSPADLGYTHHCWDWPRRVSCGQDFAGLYTLTRVPLCSVIREGSVRGFPCSGNPHPPRGVGWEGRGAARTPQGGISAPAPALE